MAELTEEEKKRILCSADTCETMHTYLCGMNGDPGWLSMINSKLDKALDKQEKTDAKVNKIIGVFICIAIICGSVTGGLYLV